MALLRTACFAAGDWPIDYLVWSSRIVGVVEDGCQ